MQLVTKRSTRCTLLEKIVASIDFQVHELVALRISVPVMQASTQAVVDHIVETLAEAQAMDRSKLASA